MEGRKGERRGQDRAGGTSQENDVDPGRYLSSAGRCTVEIAPSSGPVSLYIDIRVSRPLRLCSVSLRVCARVRGMYSGCTMNDDHSLLFSDDSR